jgi:hypothetical protein
MIPQGSIDDPSVSEEPDRDNILAPYAIISHDESRSPRNPEYGLGNDVTFTGQRRVIGVELSSHD